MLFGRGVYFGILYGNKFLGHRTITITDRYYLQMEATELVGRMVFPFKGLGVEGGANGNHAFMQSNVPHADTRTQTHATSLVVDHPTTAPTGSGLVGLWCGRIPGTGGHKNLVDLVRREERLVFHAVFPHGATLKCMSELLLRCASQAPLSAGPQGITMVASDGQAQSSGSASSRRACHCKQRKTDPQCPTRRYYPA